MCIICKDYVLGRLTNKEAKRNLQEMESVIEEDHMEEVSLLLWADPHGDRKDALKKIYLEQESPDK